MVFAGMQVNDSGSNEGVHSHVGGQQSCVPIPFPYGPFFIAVLLSYLTGVGSLNAVGRSSEVCPGSRMTETGGR